MVTSRGTIGPVKQGDSTNSIRGAESMLCFGFLVKKVRLAKWSKVRLGQDEKLTCV